MGQQWLVAAGAVISARGVERRKLGRSDTSLLTVSADKAALQSKIPCP